MSLNFSLPTFRPCRAYRQGPTHGRRSASPRPGRACRRPACLAGSSTARAGLAALACVALLCFAVPAHAQTQVTLVSNYASRHATETLTVGDQSATETLLQAQRFGTGPRPIGYPLTSVKFRVANLDDENVSPRVSIYSLGSNSDPGTELYLLSGTFSEGEVTLTAPANTVLAANTDYFVYFEDTNTTEPRGAYTIGQVNDSQTDSGLSGWSVGFRRHNSGDGNWVPSTRPLVAIELQGSIAATIAPVFSDTTLTRSIAENTPADQNIGAVIPAATDADNDTLEYSMAGPDAASFTFDAATRQIKTKAALDHEGKSSHSVTVKADDGYGGTDTVDVTITVTDAIERAPTLDRPMLARPSGGSYTTLIVSWTVPNNDGLPSITDYDVQWRSRTTSEWGDGPQNVEGTSATLTGLRPDREYRVRVRADNDERPGPWSDASPFVFTNNPPLHVPSTSEVPANWRLKPGALGVGDKFRLLFVTEQRYNVFERRLTYFDVNVYGEAEGGHVDIQEHFASFSPLACNYQNNAIVNTGTPTSESGVSVYWLNGEKVADNYADLYDGSWDSDQPRNSLGQAAPTSGDGGRVAHGCQASGRGHEEHYIGAGRIETGQPGTSGSELEGGNFNPRTGTFRMYGLSGIFQVVASSNSAPDFAATTLTREIAENTAADVNVGDAIPAATDADDDDLEYTMEGTDKDSFNFNESTLQLTTKTGVTYDYEDKSSYSVTIKVEDDNGRDDTVDVTINITDMDEPPSAPTGLNVAPTLGSPTSLDASWTAPANDGKPEISGYDLQFRIAGAEEWENGAKGVEGTSATIADLIANTRYEVHVRANNNDGAGTWSSIDSATTNTTNNAPTASNGSVTTDEDTAHTFAADDFNFSDTDSGDTLALVEVVTLPTVGTLQLDGTDVTLNQDVTKAQIDADDLEFTPAANGNGTGYASFTFKVSDGTDKSDSAYTMTVNVTAVNDAATGAPTIGGTARVGQTLTAATTGIADVDGLTGVSYTYQWVRVDSGTDSDIASATSSTYTLVDDDLGKTIKVEVSFTDDGGSSEELTSAATGVVAANNAPEFSDATLTREIAENTPADTDIGDAIPAATDADDDALKHTLEGTDETSFNFNESTLQLTTKAGVTYDYEKKSSYSVTIKVEDDNGGTDTVAVTINVTDVDEPPLAPTGVNATPTLGAGGSLDVVWTAPGNDGKPVVLDYDLQFGTSDSGPWSNGPQGVSGTSSTISELAGNTLYHVRVHARNAEGDGAWSSTDSATTRTATNSTNCPAPDLTGRTQIWSATLSVGQGRISNAVTYVGFNTLTPHDVFGALSDTSLDIGINSYTVQALSVVPIADELWFGLDSFLQDTEKAELTLHVCNDDFALSSASQNTSFGFNAYQWELLNPNWVTYATRDVYLSVPNNAPTASNGTVTTDEDTAHTFEADDFSFSDTDSGDTLSLVEVVTLPTVGTLTLDGAAVTVNKDVAVADIGKLVFTPAANANGDGYASFTFKVSDGTDKSADAYTMTVNVTAVNDAATGLPTISGTARVGETLTASTTGIEDVDGLTGVSYAYQWVRVDNGTDSDIASATSSTYTLVDDDLGKTVKVEVSFTDDGGAGEELMSAETATIMAGSTNNAPVFSDATLTRSVAENPAANVNVGAVIPEATDADVGATLEYSMEGADAASFNFNVSTRQITTKSGVHYDFEAKPSHSVTIKVSDGTDSDTVAVTITLTDQADTGDSSLSPSADDVVPARKSRATYSIRIEGSWNTGVTPGGVPSNSPHFTTFVGGIHNDRVTFLESGGTASAGVESMAETGSTSALAAEVNAAKPNADRALTLGAPGITGGRTHSNIAFTSDHPRITLTSMIAPTPDWFVGVSGRSLLDSSGNWLASLTVNLYPWDAGTENGSEFSLSNANTSPKGAIASIRGRGKFTGEHIARLVFTRTGSVEQAPAAPTTFAATPSDAEVTLGWDVPSVSGITGHEYRRKTDGAYGAWTAIPDSAPSGANEDSFTVTGLTNDTMYTFQVRAVNSVGGGVASAEVSATPMTGGNAAPEFTDATLTREIAENTAANVNVGAVIPEATDADVGATLEYSMEGADAASFNFDVSTRQISTKADVTYDFEATKNSYSVTIRVSDGADSDTVAVTISLTNVIELPSAPTGLTVSPTLGAGGSLDASWTAPTNTDKPTITGYKLQYATSSSGPWSNGPQNVTGTSSTITKGLAENTLYYVRVLAFNSDGDGAWSSTDSATTRIATTSANCPAPTLTGRAQIWSATVSAETGRVNDGLVPYIGFNTVTPHDVFGALSDTSFQVGTNSYTVRTLATIPTIDDALFLSLDRHVTDTEKAELTLHVCDDAVALSSATQVDAAGFKAYQWAYGVDWSDYATREAYLSVPSDNSAPTASNGTVTTDEDTAHTFAAAEFNFADTDSGDTLELVEVVTLPSDGTLTFDGDAATVNKDVAVADIGKLVFTPAANANGTGYASFTFKVSDGTDKSDSAYTMTVDVTAVNDAATGLPTISGTPQVGETLTASTTGIADVDGLTGVSYTYQWVRVDNGTDSDIASATSSTYTLVGDDEGNTVKVKVSFTDDGGTDEGPLTSAETATIMAAPANSAPDFAATTLAREVAENSVADVNVGAVIPEATDADNDTLEYSMEGADAASFNFDVSTRQISTKSGVTYNFEATKNSYSVTIGVSDGADSDTVAVTINLTNVIELPSAPTGLEVAPTLGSGGSLDASWTAPTNTDKPTITGYKLQYATISAGPWSNGPQGVTGTSSTITTGLAEDTLYYVRVLAFNSDGDGAWSSTDSATTRIATTSANCPAPTLTGRAQIWSATVSAETGRVNDGLVPYIGFNTVTPHDVFGALSDTSFQVGTNSYTVRTLATIPTIERRSFP